MLHQYPLRAKCRFLTSELSEKANRIMLSSGDQWRSRSVPFSFYLLQGPEGIGLGAQVVEQSDELSAGQSG
jgi:hypothetical protein